MKKVAVAVALGILVSAAALADEVGTLAANPAAPAPSAVRDPARLYRANDAHTVVAPHPQRHTEAAAPAPRLEPLHVEPLKLEPPPLEPLRPVGS